MRLIDADRLKKKFCHHCEDDGKCKEQCFDLDIIDTMPTIDVMPVVKCKYCEHCFPLVKGGICKMQRTEVTEEDFCDWWERRKNGRFNKQTGGD